MTNPNPETADRELRDRIAEELAARFTADGSVSQGMRVIDPDDDGDPEPARAVRPLEAADAVLAVLPSVVRARVLHDAADRGAAERLARVLEWVTGEVVTAKTEFGNGYRAAQRDIRDLVKGRFDNDAANELRRLAAEQPTNTETVALCRCGHGAAYHDAKYADPQCRLCPEDGERMWRHSFTPPERPAVVEQPDTQTREAR